MQSRPLGHVSNMQDFALETQSWPSLGEVKTSPLSPLKKLRPSKENVTVPSPAPALLASPVVDVRPPSPVAAAAESTQAEAVGAPTGNSRHSKSKKKGTRLHH